MTHPRARLIAVLGFAALVAAIVLRPTYQPIVLFFFRNHVIFATIITTIVAMISLRVINQYDRTYQFKSRSALAGVIGGLIIIFLMFLTNSFRLKSIYNEVGGRAVSITSAPDTTTFRWMPYDVALERAKTKTQDSLVKIGDIDPVLTADGIAWQAPRIPNGFWNKYAGTSNGTFRFESNEETTVEPANQIVGEGMGLTDSVKWQLRKKRYLANYSDGYYVRGDGNNGGKDTLYFIAPYTTYRFSFPVMVPQWGGVMVVNTATGDIFDLTPEEAQMLPLLENQWLVPEKLARAWIASWAYKHGIRNAWFGHRDQIEIPSIDGSWNQMPYLIPTTDGMAWFVAAEPDGDSTSVYKMFWVMAHTGELRILELDSNSTLTGPNGAQTSVRSALSQNDWTSGVKTVEPRPIFKDGKLYWQVTITDLDSITISSTVLVNAKDNKVLSCGQDQAGLKRFLETGQGCQPVQSCMGSQTLSPQQLPSTALNGQFKDLSEKELWDLAQQTLAELEQRNADK